MEYSGYVRPWGCVCIGLASVQRYEPTRQLVECSPPLARRVVLGCGVPLYYRRKSYAARVDTLPGILLGAHSGRRSKDFWVLWQQINKQTNKQEGSKAERQTVQQRLIDWVSWVPNGIVGGCLSFSLSFSLSLSLSPSLSHTHSLNLALSSSFSLSLSRAHARACALSFSLSVCLSSSLSLSFSLSLCLSISPSLSLSLYLSLPFSLSITVSFSVSSALSLSLSLCLSLSLFVSLFLSFSLSLSVSVLLSLSRPSSLSLSLFLSEALWRFHKLHMPELVHEKTADIHRDCLRYLLDDIYYGEDS